ncbi:MAG: tRNA (guanosine(37)-N1)-methyltransferase TrmD, partial [Bacteroidota bacterium]|nr:tRNA (guanosine(37)-N1)-methyltransferase TrmD [Bacteroidota bacterium]
MRIDIITVLPGLLRSPFDESIIRRARQKGIAEINIIDLRDYSTDKHRSVDDYPFGGGAGMVMMIEPVYNCISHLKSERHYDEIIYTSPDGARFTQAMANELSMKENIIILAGHYKGIDQRIRDHLITREISIGDYVLTGGELPAAVITDAVVRLLPGAISDAESALSDSFQDGLLAPPQFTRPAEFMGWKV